MPFLRQQNPGGLSGCGVGRRCCFCLFGAAFWSLLGTGTVAGGGGFAAGFGFDVALYYYSFSF